MEIGSCDGCIHKEVCGKKDTYNKWAEAVKKVGICTDDKSYWPAESCDDISISLKCKYYCARWVHDKMRSES